MRGLAREPMIPDWRETGAELDKYTEYNAITAASYLRNPCKNCERLLQLLTSQHALENFGVEEVIKRVETLYDSAGGPMKISSETPAALAARLKSGGD
jgi:tellurite resistance protein